MAFNIGGNDVANSFGTSVGAGTLTLKQALIVAAIFEVSGAMIAGGEVTKTIRKGIVDLGPLNIEPMMLVYIMMSALIAAALWLLIATKKALPVSTTHSIIGGLVGSSITLGFIVSGGDTAFALVNWNKIGLIAMSWVLSPLLGGIMAYGIYWSIKRYIINYNENVHAQLTEIKKQKKQFKKSHQQQLKNMTEQETLHENYKMAKDAQVEWDSDFDRDDIESDYYRKIYALNERKKALKPHHAMEVYLPLVAAFGAMIISAMVIFKGMKHIDLDLSTLENYLVIMMIGATIWMSTYIFVRTLRDRPLDRMTVLMFSWLQVFTAAGFAFSHGSNDIANAMGPFAAVLDILRNNGEMIGSSAAVPAEAMFVVGIGLVAGLWFIGKNVIQTVGHHLTQMHPASGFSAELGASAVILMASTFGIPVSSTHILIGAVLGIGLVNKNTNWGLMKPIILAWIITLPAAAILASIFFIILKNTL
jgi:inorganic phosphate transporter, PiT family